MSLSDLGVTGIICLVVLVFTVIGFLKGLIRTALAMVCLATSGYAALWANEHTSQLTIPWADAPTPWLPKIAALVTGIIVFCTLRYIFKFIVNPFNNSDTGKRFGFGLSAALVCLLIGIVILWGVFTGIRYKGGLSEIRHTRHLAMRDKNSNDTAVSEPWILSTKRSLDSWSAGRWQRKTDPFHTPGQLKLCRLLIMYQNTGMRVKMLTHAEIHRVLNNPVFIKLAFDKSLQEILQSSTPKVILRNPQILEILADKRLVDDILALKGALLTSINQD